MQHLSIEMTAIIFTVPMDTIFKRVNKLRNMFYYVSEDTPVDYKLPAALVPVIVHFVFSKNNYLSNFLLICLQINQSVAKRLTAPDDKANPVHVIWHCTKFSLISCNFI